MPSRCWPRYPTAAANVLPSYAATNRFSGLSTDQALLCAKQGLRDYVKFLYAHGQGEWDSSSYLMFDLHGMLNIYDFARMKIADDGFTDPAGRTLRMKFSPDEGGDAHGDRLADVNIDGKPVPANGWPLYSGPFVTQQPGVLTLTDGSDGYVVDFTGDLPVYRNR